MAKCQEMTTRNRKSSASSLTPEQIQSAHRSGINPRRLAWILKCPHGGHANPGCKTYSRKTS
jgi:hypothetical protein